MLETARMLLTASEGGGSFVVGNVTDRMTMVLLEATVESPPNAPGQVAARCYGAFNRKTRIAPCQGTDQIVRNRPRREGNKINLLSNARRASKNY